MTLRQRQIPTKDAAHLAFVRRQPCCCGCGRAAPSEAAHLRFSPPGVEKRPTGMGEKPSDNFTVPLNAWCHREGPGAQHRGNEGEFWERRHVNPFPIADRLWIESGAAARHVDPAPPKPRQRKPRPRSTVKRQWPSRPMQSRSKL